MLLPRTPQGVVFDMDGVIFETEALYRDTMMATAVDHGCIIPESLFLQLIGLPSDVSRTMLEQHLGLDFDLAALLLDARTRFRIRVEEGNVLKPGVVELLDHLGWLGIPHAIATSSKHDAVAHHLAAHDLVARFPIVVAFGDYARGKPNPDPFLTAAGRLGLAPDVCLALEDSHNGVRAASGAGMMTVMVPDLLAPTDEIRALCVGVLPDLLAVKSLLS